MQTQTHKRFCYLYRRPALIVVRLCVVLVLALLFLGGCLLRTSAPAAHAQTATSLVATTSQPAKGTHNPFPYGSCTWWGSQRYHQLTGIYVPWTTQAMAWQWTARAKQFHWKVSTHPTAKAIIDLQPWVQGAYSSGHVAVVEKVLANGQVIASNMSWGAHPWSVVDVKFKPGPGVTFISY
jgi:surface antigen